LARLNDMRSAKFGSGKSTAVVVAAVVLTVLSGCAGGMKSASKPTGPLPWTAAIGRLDNDKDSFSCTATLVAPDTIVTAAHCLFLRGRQVDPANLAFTPFVGGSQRLTPSQGVQIVAVGGKVEGDKSPDGDTEEDWGVVKIAPAITGVKPLGIANMGADEIGKKLDSGATLSNAGYGVYGIMVGKRLHQRDGCKLEGEWASILALGHNVIISSCPVIQGDSGGPIMLTEKDGTRSLVGVISGYWRSKDGKDQVSFGASSANFAAKLSLVDAAVPAAQP
jgi:protease YdgD